jgi:DNA-binding MarR family transcriptional regulator
MEPNLRRKQTDDKINRLLKVINLLRLYDREVPAQVLATLFYIGSHNDCHKTALEEDLNFTTASSSRNTDKLSKDHRFNGKLDKNGKPMVRAGYDLIVKEAEEVSPYRQRLKLSKKGEDLMNQIKQILYGP